MINKQVFLVIGVLFALLVFGIIFKELFFLHHLSKRIAIQDGQHKRYYPSGNLLGDWNYKNDKLDGEGKEFYEDGNIKYKDIWRHGELMQREVYDRDGTLVDSYGQAISTEMRLERFLRTVKDVFNSKDLQTWAKTLADEKSNADERIPPEHWPAFVTRLNGFLGNPRWILLIVSGTNADNAVVLIEYEDTFELRGIAIVPAGKKLPQDTPRKATYLEWRDGVYVYHSR